MCVCVCVSTQHSISSLVASQPTSSIAHGMSLLADISDDDDEANGPQNLVGDVAEQPQPVAEQPQPPKIPSARHGGYWERRAAMAKLRARKAHLKQRGVVTQQAQDLVQLYRKSAVRRRHHLQACLPKRWRSRRGNLKTGLRLSLRGDQRAALGCKHRSVSFEEICGIAEQTQERDTSLALLHSISTTWVRQLRVFFASAYLALQSRMLGQLVELSRSCKPAFVLRRLSFDETGQKLTLSVPGCSAEQECSVWQVMVARLAVTIGWDGRGVYNFDIVLPPLLVTSTSAEHIYRALHCRQYAGIFAAIHLLGSLSDEYVELDETDAAPANHKLHAASLMKDEKAYKCHKMCSLHQNQLIEVQLLAVTGMSLLSRLYSLTLLLHTSGYFVKMLSGLRKLVDDHMVIRDVRVHGAPAAAATAYAKEVMSYIVRHYKRFEKATCHERRRHHWVREAEGEDEAGSESGEELDELLERARRGRGGREANRARRQQEGREASAGAQAFLLDVSEFMAVFNGPWWENGLIHYCDGCCRGPAHTAQRMTHSLKRGISLEKLFKG